MASPTQADWELIRELIWLTNFIVKIGLDQTVKNYSQNKEFYNYVQDLMDSIPFDISQELFPEFLLFCQMVFLSPNFIHRKTDLSEDRINKELYNPSSDNNENIFMVPGKNFVDGDKNSIRDCKEGKKHLKGAKKESWKTQTQQLYNGLQQRARKRANKKQQQERKQARTDKVFF